MATMPANYFHLCSTGLRIKILSAGRGKHLLLPFIFCNVVFKLHGEPYAVKAFEQEFFAELVYLKMHLAAACHDQLLCKVNLDIKVLILEQIVDFVRLEP